MENLTLAGSASQLALVGPSGAMPLDRPTVEALAEFFVGMLDLVEPDTDVEETDAEDELLSARALAIEEDKPGCIASDAGDIAWIERVDQDKPGLPRSNIFSEDAEEDDGDGECTDDVPAFDPHSRAVANSSAYGPGCVLSDSDYGGEEPGEACQGDYGHTVRYGVDQTKPISATNPEVR